MKRMNRGFTLIETMFSVSILLIVIIASFLAITSAMFLVQSSRNNVTAANDAQYVLEQIKTQKIFSDIPAFIASYPANKFENLSAEVVSFPNPEYFASLDTITVNIAWNERNVARNFSITTRFAQ